MSSVLGDLALSLHRFWGHRVWVYKIQGYFGPAFIQM